MSAESNSQNALSIRKKLIRRSQALSRARQFFLSRGLIETDCLLLGQSASIDLHIDLFSVDSPIHGKRFLFSSPEYPMKRLLAAGSGDIFYLGHVFRHEEAGRFHSPEFTMAEWYRVGFTFNEMIQETLDFILDTLQLERSEESISDDWDILHLTYEEAFLDYCHLNPHTIPLGQLQKKASEIIEKLNLSIPFNLADSSRDEILHLLMSLSIEPALKREKTIAVLSHYPSSQAALAQTVASSSKEYSVSERFEIYVEGLEVANGYHELIDPIEQRRRFLIENEERIKTGKESYPIDERFLRALSEDNPPPSCGVAVGFDRLLMKLFKASSISEVLPIGWSEA